MIYLKLAWAYLKIGLFGFGGGYAMLSLIQSVIVDSGWIDSQTFTDIVAISQMTPGPIGINSATYIGFVAPAISNPAMTSPWWGIMGSVLCTLIVVIPAFVLTLQVSHIIHRHRESTLVRGIFLGIRPIVVGLIASAAMLLMNSANFGTDAYQIFVSIMICIIAFALVYWVKLHPIVVIILSGIAGYLLF